MLKPLFKPGSFVVLFCLVLLLYYYKVYRDYVRTQLKGPVPAAVSIR